MKNIKQIILSLLITTALGLNAQVAINTDGTDADASAILDVKSTQKGFLPPRMTEAEKNAVANPVSGLIIYQTNGSAGLYQYSGSAWGLVGSNAMAAGTQTGEMLYWDGSEWITFEAGIDGQVLEFVDGAPNWETKVGDNFVINFTTGKIWMDRNLGASQVAENSTDVDAYGDLYQWGRHTDGHEKRNSANTSNISSSDTPGHGSFIFTNSGNSYDWRNPQNDNLWQGVNGINNPCPSGYRLPTSAEWSAELSSWSNNNSSGAFNSVLKLTVAGSRLLNINSIHNVGVTGYYCSSTISGIRATIIFFESDNAGINNQYRGFGNSVRCIKD